ncbi:hypothetical protein FOMPIDRAFT_1129047, partial [Fomitopsis schrenkii]
MAKRETLEQQKAYHYECIRAINTHHNECIRAINTQLNELVPVSQIPPELLSKIFLHTAGQHAYPARVPPQICVTHVCRHWREVALQCAALWSHVDVPALPEKLAEFLKRSKDAPLSMTLSFRPLRWHLPSARQLVPPEDAALSALSALHRVQTLTVDASEDPTDVVLEHMGGRAPLLESLTITSRGLSLSKLIHVRESISRMLSHPESRRLRTLATDLCCLTWKEIPWDGLTRLEVHSNGHSDPGEPGIPSFFKALSHMPCLKELELRKV